MKPHKNSYDSENNIDDDTKVEVHHHHVHYHDNSPSKENDNRNDKLGNTRSPPRNVSSSNQKNPKNKPENNPRQRYHNYYPSNAKNKDGDDYFSFKEEELLNNMPNQRYSNPHSYKTHKNLPENSNRYQDDNMPSTAAQQKNRGDRDGSRSNPKSQNRDESAKNHFLDHSNYPNHKSPISHFNDKPRNSSPNQILDKNKKSPEF